MALLAEKTIQNIPVREIELEVRRKDGSIIIGLFSADKITIGKDECLLTMMVDITERKRAETELRKARTEAEKANLAKSEFLSRMSHELRTPMNSILGFAQLMQMGELSQAQKKGVNHILTSGTHLLNLINEVLDISRIEAGRLTLSLEPVQVSSVILEMIDVVQPHGAKRNLKIEMEQSPACQLFIKADRQRLKQVLLNLINNAVKYNKDGGSVLIKAELRKDLTRAINTLRISVADTGIGIVPDDLKKLFLPFERIGAEKSETEGTGLGLTVVKKLMDAMGGVTGVESIPGEGSVFWIELPESQSQKKQQIRVTDDPENTSATVPKSGVILYIEDNLPNAELVEDIIQNHRPGISLITSPTGKYAVMDALNFRPDLILLDLDLPDVHGSKVLADLQENASTRHIPVVIISADAMPQQVAKLMTAGARDYLTKPLDIIGFLQMVDEYFG
jgi:signal transduction histidine kinase/CheY-like chemotaxis protein